MKNEHDDSLLPPISEDGFKTLLPLNQTLPQITGYRILGLLGSGGMGTTWRAVQLSTNREVAIKMMAAHILGSQKAQQRFVREIEFAARIEHPNIARVYDSGLQSGVFYYSMELIKGIPLDRYAKEKHLTQKDILEIVKKVSETIQYAHQQGIIHRDLKPSNILVTEDGNPHVLDFGLAKTLDKNDHHATISIDGEIAGTPAFMSPEQAAGNIKIIDTRTDIYSLGVILYYLLTDKFPHRMDGPRHEVIRRITEDDIIRPRLVSPDIDRELESLLLGALSHEPDLRYSSADKFANDLGNYINGEPLAVKKQTVLYFLGRKLKKHYIPVSIASVILVLLMAIAIFSYYRIAYQKKLTSVALEREQKAHDAETKQRKLLEIDVYRYGILKANSLLSEKDPYLAFMELDSLSEKLRNIEFTYVMGKSIHSICELNWEKNFEGIKSICLLQGNEGMMSMGDHGYLMQNVESGDILHEYSNQNSNLNLCFSSNGNFVFADKEKNNEICLRNSNDPETCLELGKLNGTYFSAAFSDDNRFLAVCDESEIIRIWNADSGEIISKINPRYDNEIHLDMIRSLIFSPNSRYIAAIGLAENTFRLWDTFTGQLYRSFEGHTGPPFSLAFSPDGKYIASAGADKTVKLWRIETGENIATFMGHNSVIGDVAFSPNGKYMASVSYDNTAKLWDIESKQLLLTIREYAFPNIVKFSPDSQNLLVVDHQRSRITNFKLPKLILEERINHSERFFPCNLFTFVYTKDKKPIIGHTDGSIIMWDVDKTYVFDGPMDMILSLAVSPDGKYLAASSLDHTLRIWNINTQVETCKIEYEIDYPGMLKNLAQHFIDPNNIGYIKYSYLPNLHEEPDRDDKSKHPDSIAFLPDSRHIVSSTYDSNDIEIFDITTGKTILQFSGNQGIIAVIAVSPDGKIASGSKDGVIKIWNSQTGDELFTLQADASAISSLAFSPDNNYLISGDDNAKIRVWDTSSWTEKYTLNGHTGRISSLDVSPDSSRLISGSGDKTVKLWLLEIGKELLTISDYEESIRCVKFSPDGEGLGVLEECTLHSF